MRILIYENGNWEYADDVSPFREDKGDYHVEELDDSWTEEEIDAYVCELFQRLDNTLARILNSLPPRKPM